MNHQTQDDDFLVYKGLFTDNGMSGYVLKPKFLLDPGKIIWIWIYISINSIISKTIF